MFSKFILALKENNPDFSLSACSWEQPPHTNFIIHFQVLLLWKPFLFIWCWSKKPLGYFYSVHTNICSCSDLKSEDALQCKGRMGTWDRIQIVLTSSPNPAEQEPHFVILFKSCQTLCVSLILFCRKLFLLPLKLSFVILWKYGTEVSLNPPQEFCCQSQNFPANPSVVEIQICSANSEAWAGRREEDYQ